MRYGTLQMWFSHWNEYCTCTLHVKSPLTLHWTNYLKLVASLNRQNHKSRSRSIVILLFSICVNGPFYDAILGQNCRHFTKLTFGSRHMTASRVDGPREGVNASGRGGEDASFPVISFPKVRLYGIKLERLSDRQSFEVARHVSIESNQRWSSVLRYTLQRLVRIYNLWNESLYCSKTLDV